MSNQIIQEIMSKKKQNNNEAVEVRSDLSDLRIENRSENQTPSRTIVGYAAKFERWSEPIMGWFKEQISRDAFNDTDKADVIMCFNHDVNAILARTTSGTLRISTDEVGLRFEFDAPQTSLGNDILELVRRGDINKCSFKFSVDKDSWRYADKENKLEYDERTVEHISRLYDVSIVVYPAYKDTEASVRTLEERKAEWLKSQEPQTVELNTSSRDRLLQFLNLKNS